MRHSKEDQKIGRQIQSEDLQVATVYPSEFETCQDLEVRKVGGKRYVTEERLNQFERDITDSLTTSITDTCDSITKSVGSLIKEEMRKMNKPQFRQSNQNRTNGERAQKVKCYGCQQEGHYKRDCPKADKAGKPSINQTPRPGQSIQPSLN